MNFKFNIIIALLFSFVFLKAQEDSTHVSFSGQFTAWGIGQLQNPFGTQFGGRFVPTLIGNFASTPQSNIDFEASLNINGSFNFSGMQYDSVMGQFKPYRVWARYSGQNWEVRAGLQKINFGSAKMFRPLMWFDAMDIRDPLQLTDGVYGILGKYYFKNNANIWLWGLIGNKNPKGYELYGSEQWNPEFGSRFQIPAGPGQLAISSHHRKVLVPNLASSIPNYDFLLNEERVGLDGKWDVGIGLWFETSLTLTDKKNYTIPTVFNVQDAWNIGADYTFGIGNGLGMTVEYFRYHVGNHVLVDGTTLNLIGSLLTYPVSMIDNLSAMVFYIPGPNLWLNYVNWSRNYDNWSLYAVAYWNPDNFQLLSSEHDGMNLFTGKGIQLMVNYNF